jgi:hypothetical protein
MRWVWMLVAAGVGAGLTVLYFSTRKVGGTISLGDEFTFGGRDFPTS